MVGPRAAKLTLDLQRIKEANGVRTPPVCYVGVPEAGTGSLDPTESPSTPLAVVPEHSGKAPES